MAGSEAPRTIRLDARNLRGIAHPLRVRILWILREEGPATATTLARRLGLNTGATSYHLRQLAAHGFVEEETGRGSTRERWWRSAHAGTVVDYRELGRDGEGLGWAYLRGVAEMYAESMNRAVDEMPTLPDQWREAATLSDYQLLLTADELRDLRREVVAIIRRYRRFDHEAPDAPPGAVPVTFQFQTFPRPGVLEAGAGRQPDGDRQPDGGR